MARSRSRLVSVRFARLLLLCALVVGTTAAPHAAAVKPTKVAFPVEVTYQIPELSEICGFEVWFGLEGTFKGLLFRNKSGVIVGEFNAQPNTWLVLYSPETGESLHRIPFAVTFHYRYPEGTDPGDRAIVTATGFTDKLPGLKAAAGRAVFPDAVVVAVEDGVPLVEFGEPSITRGSEPNYELADAAICGALDG